MMARGVFVNDNVINNVLKVLWVCVFCYHGICAKYVEEPGRNAKLFNGCLN